MSGGLLAFGTLVIGPLGAQAPVEAGGVNAPVAGEPTPDRARIVGAVLSAEGGVPVTGAEVQVEGQRSRTVTDARGAFVLAGVETRGEPVVLSFTRLGFAPARAEVNVADGGTARVEVVLEPRPVVLPAVAVLFERTRMLGDPEVGGAVPGSAFVLDGTEMRAGRMAFDNVHELLRQVPGVTVQDEEGYGLRPNIGLRGAGAERSGNITLMEDGVLIAPAPYSAPAAYFFPALGRMEGIEVRKGASQVRYGPRTLGGAVNLVSAGIPEARHWQVEVGGGEDATVRAHARLGDRGSWWGWMVEGLESRTDGFKDLETGGPTGFQLRDLMARFRVNTPSSGGPYQELELKLGRNDQVSDETYLGLTDEDFRIAPTLRYAGSAEDVLNTAHRQLQLRYFLRPSAGTDLVVTGYRNTFDRNWYKLSHVNGTGIAPVLADPTRYASELAVLRGADSGDDALAVRANNRGYLSSGIQAAGGLRLETAGVRHHLEVGARYHRDEEDRLQWDDGYRMVAGQMLRTSAGAPGSQDNRMSEAEAWAFFLQDELRAGRLTLVPGIRYEAVDFTQTRWSTSDPDRDGDAAVRENRVSALIPGLGATWEWSPRTHLFAGAHRGFGPPGPGADADTRSEESVNLEAGVRVRRALVGANITAFHSAYENILGRATLATGESGSGELFNGGAARVSGVETALDLELGRTLGVPFRIPARLAWTWTRGTFASDFTSGFGPWGTVAAGDRIPYLPEHAYSGHLGVDDGVRTLTLSWNGASAMRTEAGSGAFAPGTGADRFVVLNLRGEWALPGQGTLFAGVQNLADQVYVASRRPAGVRPGLPRTFFVGVRVTN